MTRGCTTTGGAAARPARARLRESAGNTFQPPGRKPAGVLTDAIIHSQDIFVPLGIGRHAGAAAVLAALVIGVPRGPPLHTGRRAAGLRLRATDPDWQWGQGEEVIGTGEALLMTLTGRGAFASRLSGPGAALLAERGQIGAPRSSGANPGC